MHQLASGIPFRFICLVFSSFYYNGLLRTKIHYFRSFYHTQLRSFTPRLRINLFHKFCPPQNPCWHSRDRFMDSRSFRIFPHLALNGYCPDFRCEVYIKCFSHVRRRDPRRLRYLLLYGQADDKRSRRSSPTQKMV